MTIRTNPFRRKILAACVGAAWLTLAAEPARAATNNWLCADGDWWRSDACWSLGHAPGTGDNVALPASVRSATITWVDPLTPGVVLGTLNLTSVPGQGQTTVRFLQPGAGTLASAVEVLGSLGSASHIQSGGTNRTGRLVLGTGNDGYRGNYVLSGDNARLDVAGNIEMGSERSNGTFQQSGGVATAGQLQMSAGTGHVTAFDLSGGVFISGATAIGAGGAVGGNTFTQSGGTHQAGSLTLGSVGANYLLQAGELRAGQIVGATAANFQWTGGALHMARTQLIGDGSFFLESNGVFAVGNGRSFGADTLQLLASGTLLHGGGTVRVDAGNTFSNQGTHGIDLGRMTVEGTARNSGLTLMTGGTLDGAGFYTNSGVFNGYGNVAGSLNFRNEGVLQVNGGTLAFRQANITAFNTGTLSFDAITDRLHLDAIDLPGVGRVATLYNQGSVVLSGQQITGSGIFVNAIGGVTSGWGSVQGGFANEGTLNIEGGTLQVTAGFTNMGLVQLSGAAARLAGGVVNNMVTLQGNGTVASDIVNTGVIEPRGGTLVLTTPNFVNQGTLTVSGGNMLYFAAAGLSRNEGLVSLSGGTLDNGLGDIANAGVISGHGVMRAAGVANSGRLQLSGGSSELQATFNNLQGGVAIVSGNANMTFASAAEFQAGSELRVSEGAVATFFGMVVEHDGALFTGTGAKYFEGGLSLGRSPALAREAGSVSFGVRNTYVAELGGLVPGSLFDKYIVDGALTLGGTLQLKTLAGFAPHAGDRFDLFDWGSATGQFSSVDLSQAALDAGLQWDLSQLYSTGAVSVAAVPEPASGALLLAGGAALWGRVRRVHRRAVSGGAVTCP